VQDHSSNPITCGTVTFNDQYGGGSFTLASNVPLGSPSSDQAQITTSALGTGTHNITAVYVPGLCPFNTSTSNTLVQGVGSQLRVIPATMIFGPSVYGNTGTTTSPHFETATNISGVTRNIGTITGATTSGPGAPPNFQIVSDTCSGTALAPGASCTFGVTFTPTGLGSYTGSAIVPSDAKNSPNVITATGSGVEGRISFSPNFLFSNTQVGTTNATVRTDTITNPNAVGLTVTSITPSGDFGLTPVGGTPCNLSGSTVLAGGASCTIGVSFTPTAQGTRNGSVTIMSNASNNPASVTLKGTGTLSALSVTPALRFGIVMNGTTSADKFVTVTNNNPSVFGSDTSVVVSGIATSSSTFNIDPVGTTCGTSPTYSTSLAPGASCMVAVNFSPPAVGSFSGTLNVTDNAGNGGQGSTLYGSGN
jgi:Abnormal spindle-like microcephaly-assoc'd, ASPM-SPD-2-Hydin